MNKTSHAIVRTLLLGTSCLSVAGLLIGPAAADPKGGTVVLGSATITGNGTKTVIDQKTGKAIINWNSFSIGTGESVTFNQPNASSIALNRVLGGQGSAIYGSLLANGQVWIINQNGILFAKGATINVGGLIATTADMSDTNFAAGEYSFSGGTGASVINDGTIRTRNGGGVVLSGASVQNQGLIQADTGTVVLGGASAFTVDFVGDGLLKYAITAPTGSADNGQTGVSNSGTIKAAGGQVIMTARAAASVQDAVVNNTGMISATSAKLQNGEVVLDGGDGNVNAGGTIDVSGSGRGQTGGFVSITGRDVTVADNTRINASGDAGGGTVKIGGDLRGQGALQNAANTHVGRATITADATRTGNGGTLVVWSNGLTDFSGIFSAKGGLFSGNGGFAETSGAHLKISPDAKVDTSAAHGATGTWLLDPQGILINSGEGSSAALDANGRLALATDPEGIDFISPDTIITALATTNVSLEASEYIEVDSDVIYASPHSLSLMSTGNIYAYASIQNTQASGGGAVNLIAGWDGVTVASAILSTPGSYGHDDGEGNTGIIEFLGDFHDVYVGSASGTTTLAGLAALLVTDSGGNVQVGYHGVGGGDINVLMNDGLVLSAASPGDAKPYYAQIGNGALDGTVSGQVTGNINVQIGGTLGLITGFDCDCGGGFGALPGGGPGAQNAGDGRTLGIGNESLDITPTGNVVLIGNDVDNSDDENGGFGRIVLNDLVYGDVTVGLLNTETPYEIAGAGTFNSPHDITLLSAGDILIDGILQNAGTGAITLVAGWDGVYDPSHLGEAGTYGNNNGTITVGGAGALGPVYLGAASGDLTLYGANLNIAAADGDAQVGYHGAGGGNIFVTMTGDIGASGSNNVEIPGSALLGNGTLSADFAGSVTGDISLYAGGQTTFTNGSNGLAWLGNVAGTGGTETGDVLLLTRSGFFRADFTVADLQGGDVFVGFYDPSVTPLFIGGFHYDAPHAFTFAAAGSMNITGGIQNAGNGAVTLVTGWDGHTVGTAAQLEAANAFGIGGATMNFGAGQYENADVGSGGGLTTILTGALVIAPAAGFHAQIGYHGNGGGDIHIVTTGDMTLTGGASAADYAMIGNGSLTGDVAGPVTGNIDIRVGATTDLVPAAGTDNAWIGNKSAGANTGNIVFVSGSFDDSGSLSAMFVSDLNGGDVTFALTDPDADPELGSAIVYNSPHALNLLFAGQALVVSDIQNAGSGAINLIAGWDGHTLDSAHYLDAGVFGNNGNGVIVGSLAAEGLASIGSAGGTTTVAGATVAVLAANSVALIGYHSGGSGAVNVSALGAVAVAASGNNLTAQIGNFAADGHTAVGDVTINSGSLTVSADGTNAVATIGNSNATGSNSGNIAINTHGGVLAVAANGTQTYAHIGNWTTGNITGTASGNVTIDAGALTMAAASGGESHIGNVALHFAADASAIAGNVTIHATSFDATSLSGGHIYLGSLGAGPVSGDILIATTGNFAVTGNGGTAQVGNIFSVLDGTGNLVQGTATGNLTVQSGGTVAMTALNGGLAGLGAGGSLSGNVNVTAAGNISVTSGVVGGTGPGGSAFIGTGTAGNSATNVSVTSTNGSILLTANQAGGSAVIETFQNSTLAGTMSGTISVTAAHGDVVLTSTGGATAYALIASIGNNGSLLNGNVSVLAGGTLNFSGAGAGAGELDPGTGTPAIVNGDVTLTANTITSTSGLAARADVLTIVQTGAGGGVGTADDLLIFDARALVLQGTGSSFFLSGTGAVDLSSVALGAGSLTLDADGAITQSGIVTAGGLDLSTSSGAIALTNTANAVDGTVAFDGAGSVSFYNTHATRLAASAAGGDFTLLSRGNVTVAGSVQLASGAVTVLAGWDGTTTDASHFADAGVYGNNLAFLVIGGGGTNANVAIGSASGRTLIEGGTVSLNSAHGYAQVGYHGGGATGAIEVYATDNVLLTSTNGVSYTQIGHGGQGVSGDESGDITVKAPFALTLASGGSSFGRYAQIGHGGDSVFGVPAALSGNIAVTAGAVTLTSFEGRTQIGHGGADRSANGSGNIVLNVTHDVTLTGGGIQTWGYALVGNGGDTSSGTDTGNIQVTAGGTVSVNAGGDFAMIGNGGWGSSGDHSGSITVNAGQDIEVVGANVNSFSFAQIGNGGDESNGANTGAITLTAGHALLIQSGDSDSQYAMIGNGAANAGANGTVGGDIDIRVGDTATIQSGESGLASIGNVASSGNAESGNLLLLAAALDTDASFAANMAADIVNGDIMLGITGGATISLPLAAYNSAHNFTLLAGGEIDVVSSVQNAGTGAITLVAGWDGHTLAPASFGTAGVAGLNSKGVVIGGTGAAGNAALGSAGGQTSIYGASLAITAVNGYAQLGFNGHGSGAILVNVTGVLTLTGGGATGQFAQLGNGGLHTAGDNGGNITVTAGGAVTLTSGAGTEAYAQLGNGGAESNSGSAGYTNQGNITVNGQDVILNAGVGQAAYVQIGNGGYKVGAGITGGTATNTGNITITVAHTVALNGNQAVTGGIDAYMQIGNGGSQSNTNPAAAAGGVDSGDITVTAPNGADGSVTITAGFGANAYAMIGNGGYAANAGPTATVASWTITGNLTVTDLALKGGDGAGNEFGVIGNGDASKNSVANVSGNIVIAANGQITYTKGAGPHSPATIGNFTGKGTVSGTITGATPPTDAITDPVIIGVTNTNTADTNDNDGDNDITTINTIVVEPGEDTSGGATDLEPPGASTTPGALASLDNGGDSSEPNTSDSATTLIADSLDGTKKAGSTTLLAGMLKQTNPTSASQTVHGVPPADQDFSSWGNEALWQ